MARVPDAEKQTLRKAAESAISMIERLEKDRAKIEGRIASLRRVVEAWESISGRRRSTATDAQGADQQSALPPPRVRRGQVAKHVDAILAEAAQPLDEKDLLDQIARRFGVIYNRGTVYSALHRGKLKAKYDNVDGRWRAHAIQGGSTTPA